MKTLTLKKKINNIFKKFGLSSEHSNICAKAIINAELVGAPSHGLSRTKMYCERIRKKVINAKPKIKVNNISKSIALVDADDSIGFVAAEIGIKKAINNASKTGIGLVAIKKSGHYGLSGYYAERAVKKNMIALCFTNAPPAIAPHGAKKKLFGTNPICFACPSGNSVPFVFDSSMSIINRGKIRIAEKLGNKIPIGSALDIFGKPTTDAKKAIQGVQLPHAGFRGSGLAWMVDILSGVFTGSSHSGKVKDPFDDFSGPQNIGHLFIVIKSNLFNKNYKKQMIKNIIRVKRLPKIKGVKEIVYPGQNKYKRYKINLKKKINISKKILKELNELDAVQ